MEDQPDVERLWTAAEPPAARFDPERELADLPEPARRYLGHAMLPRAPLSRAVRLRMEGTIQLEGRWWPFTAEQVLRAKGAMIWSATVRMWRVPVVGFDGLLDGRGQMLWRVLDRIPLVRADGRDVTRSAAGRVAAETIWLPSAFLLDPDADWDRSEGDVAVVERTLSGEAARVELGLRPDGGVRTIAVQRWGNPDGVYGYFPFGGVVEEEARFGSFTLPSRVRVGWHWGTDRFAEGELLRATVTAARFR